MKYQVHWSRSVIRAAGLFNVSFNHSFLIAYYLPLSVFCHTFELAKFGWVSFTHLKVNTQACSLGFVSRNTHDSENLKGVC